MPQFFHTVKIFHRNPFINPYVSTIKHIAWQLRKTFNLFPCVLKLDKKTKIIIHNKIIANGCGGLINAMGHYDPNNMYLIKELTSSGTCKSFFDIGANIGIYALTADPLADVYAFEPHPVTLGLLKDNVILNNRNNIKCFGIALDENSGTISFSDVPGSTLNKIIRDNDLNVKQITVEKQSGDKFCTINKIVPDLVKVDTEGNEVHVINGFQKTIKSIKMVIVESDDINTVSSVLKNNDFIGPFKYDHKHRTFSSEHNSYEDWIFINNKYIDELETYTIMKERYL